MSLLVRDLQDRIDSSPSTPVTAALCDVRIEDNRILVPGLEDFPIEFNKATQTLLADFVGVSAPYMRKCPTDLAAHNINYWMEHDERTATFQTFGDDLLGISDPDAKSLPLTAYLQTVANVFDPTDEVVKFQVESNDLHVDVITGRTVEVPGFEGSDRRPLVGDITHGGIRLLAHPDAEKPPVVEAYMHRLVCTNGLTIADPANKISLRSKEPEQILNELELVMQREVELMTRRLEEYANTANSRIEGDRALLIFNLASERGLPRRVLQRVMDLGAELPDDASVYDVLNVFTEVAHEVKPNNAYRLQAIGGELANPHSGLLHRCSTCERPMTPDYNLL